MQKMQFLFPMKCFANTNLFLKCNAIEKLWNYFRPNYENKLLFFVLKDPKCNLKTNKHSKKRKNTSKDFFLQQNKGKESKGI